MEKETKLFMQFLYQKTKEHKYKNFFKKTIIISFNSKNGTLQRKISWKWAARIFLFSKILITGFFGDCVKNLETMNFMEKWEIDVKSLKWGFGEIFQ